MPIHAWIMSISPINSSSPMAAAVNGVRVQHKARLMSEVLGNAGALDGQLADGLQMLQAEGRSLAEAGLAVAKQDLLGTLFDALA